MRIALIHEHLIQDGGAEKTLKVLSELYCDAPIYVLTSKREVVDRYFKDRRVVNSIIQKFPGGVRHYRWYMPFMPMAIEFCDLRDFDIVISSSSSFAKGVITGPETKHICYCHTPTRYLWTDTHQYINDLKYNKFFKKIIAMTLNKIRVWDRLAADRVDLFIANSKTVQKRIKKYYKRDSILVNPPVEINRFKVADEVGDYYLAGCRLVPYKKIDLVIRAFNLLNEKNPDKTFKLKVFGEGEDIKRLQKIAGENSNIEFLGRVDDKKQAELYRRARAFINPQNEDFGITAVESLASGRPVIALNKGGATEIVEAGFSGEFFIHDDEKSLAGELEKFDYKKYDAEAIRRQTQKYSVENFKKQIKEIVDKEYGKIKE